MNASTGFGGRAHAAARERHGNRGFGAATPALRGAIVRAAVVDAFKKLDPRRMIRNPVMFVVEVGSAFTTVLFVHALATGAGEAPRVHPRGLALALVHRAVRQLRRGHGRGRGKAQAETLRKARKDVAGHAPAEAPRPNSPTRRRERSRPSSSRSEGRPRARRGRRRSSPATARSSRASPRSTRAPSPARARRSSARAAATAAP
jgi:hypothetical protein